MDSSQMVPNPDDTRTNQCAVISLEDVRSLQRSTKTTEEPGRSYNDNEPRPYPCDCGEESIRPTFFDGAWRYAVRCQACERKDRARRIRRAIELSGIPERFLGIEINEDIERAKAILSLRSLVERRGAAVVLMGPTGTGKSLLAAKTAEAWLLNGKSVSWFSEEDYYEAMRPEGKGKDRLTNDLLILDDLGSGSSTECCSANEKPPGSAHEK